MEPQGDIALIGLAVMGQNLILNMNDHGFTVVAYNRTTAKVDEFLAKEAKGSSARTPSKTWSSNSSDRVAS
jgi:6-phosphogluconate dehydrogenase